MAMEIVDFPIKNGDFPWQNVSSPEGRSQINTVAPWHPSLQVVCPPAAPALLAGAGVVGAWPWNSSFVDGFSGLTTFIDNYWNYIDNYL